MSACSSTPLVAPAKKDDDSKTKTVSDGDGSDADDADDAGGEGQDGDGAGEGGGEEGGGGGDVDVGEAGSNTDAGEDFGFGGLLGDDSDQAFVAVKPMMAVSDYVGCIACHAKIKGDLLSDFGLQKNPMSERTYHEAMDTFWASQGAANVPDGFQTLDLRGKLFIPDIKVTDSKVAGGISLYSHYQQAGTTVGAAFSLEDALTKPRRRYQDDVVGVQAETVTAIAVRDASRAPGAPGVDAIQVVKSLAISPPSIDDIKALADSKFAEEVVAGATVRVLRWSNASVAENFTVEATGNSEFALVTGEAPCVGDVVVDGILVVKDATFVSSKRGCRIYATRAIFVIGNAAATGTGASLQLASGVAIMMGIKHKGSRGTGISKLNTEQLNSDWDKIVEAEQLVDAGPYAELIQGGVQLATTDDPYRVIPASAPPGHAFGPWSALPGKTIPGACANATLPSPGAGCTVAWTQIGRSRQEYQRIVLTAPVVQSRYHGRIAGIIIANSALFALNKLEFEFDAALSEAAILPRLRKPLMTFVP